MILYRPDGLPFETSLKFKPRCCFLVTRLGSPLNSEAQKIRNAITKACRKKNYTIIDATTEVTGGDFLNKIWRLIASVPLSVGILHESFPKTTLMNICYELGMARSMGKETVIVKSSKAKYPTDLVRDEYIQYDKTFSAKFTKYLDRLDEVAHYYESMADQLDNNPLLAIDYLKRAYLITGGKSIKGKAKKVFKHPGLKDRAKNSIEILASKF